MLRNSGKLVGIALLAAGCVHAGKYSPAQNDKPTKFLRVFGSKSPSLSIQIFATYLAANSDCNNRTNWPLTVSLPRSVSIEMPVKESSDSYEAIVQLDNFQEGPCKWLPFSIEYTLKKGDILLNMPVPPVTLVWIASLGNTNSWFAREGPQSMTPLDVSCQQYTQVDKTNVACNMPLGEYRLSADAKELRANFIERKWFTVPFHN